MERAAQIGETMRERMLEWQQRWPAIGDVRGLGAMLAIELVEDPATKAPAAELATKVAEAAGERGLLLLISEAQLDEALGVWEDALDSTLSG